ncbi:uncharacterized protein HMPREF1541_09087 [Cyphellophora europaea CBS 101466]|uniref:3-oxoacyl-[acyl-carrier-protein] reductase n=1 Tax=Cyphellophora europaea (strain CBS 101466) TaxID=1220924 RepID=W2S950_CYPE1|nr:uncharacterized protein HMPREF1541_09087 [Cyphellophora europaea CBS 101466]ETN45256.1 hypothetical protein HMPREF1541_09087 [Cyphellophora europaea CBS 101466]
MDGKVVAITGAASGIGRATAQLLASQGALLSISDHDADGLEATLESLHDTVTAGWSHLSTIVNVSSASAVEEWITSTVKHFGRLDCAANIAGIHFMRPISIRQSTDEEWAQVMDINATGVFRCLRAQLKQMQSGASIVNVASIAGHVGLAGSSAYCASKHAVIGLTKAAAREEGDGGVRVNCLAPGSIKTPLTDQIPEEARPHIVATQCQKRWGDPMEAAKVIAFLLSDEATFVTGACYAVDGGWLC